VPANDYHFVSHWRVPNASMRDVYDILADATSLPRWWPALYLDVLEIQPGGTDQVDKVIRIAAKGGWLPYKLNWHFTVTDSDPPHGFGLKAWGDFDGTGRWTLTQEGAGVAITYDWRIKAEKPLLKYTSALFKPLFAVNHDWAMKKGEQSLRLEVLRRRAVTDAERAAVPAPPPPSPTLPAPALYGAAALLLLLFVRRRRRRRIRYVA
jgi:hypothetical protein